MPFSRWLSLYLGFYHLISTGAGLKPQYQGNPFPNPYDENGMINTLYPGAGATTHEKEATQHTEHAVQFGSQTRFYVTQPISVPPIDRESIIENHCKAVDHILAGTANKHPQHQIIGMTAYGDPWVIAQANADPSKQINDKNMHAFLKMRADLAAKRQKHYENFRNEVIRAAGKSLLNKEADLSTERASHALTKILDALLLKQQIYDTTYDYLHNKQYGACREYADVAAGLYFATELRDGTIGTIQQFRFSFGDGANHVYVVLNSGVDAQNISNDADAVEELHASIDDNTDAILCDHGYNFEFNQYGVVRNSNKFYGKDSENPWTDLIIRDIDRDINTYDLPYTARTVLRKIEEINNKINKLFIDNIFVPHPQHKAGGPS